MHIKQALAAYRVQKRNSAIRRIEFKLTFQQWLDFWGGDLDRRGTGVDDLQMQRRGDLGAYEIGNIIKGDARQNRVTAGCSVRNRRAKLDKQSLQSRLDALIQAPSDISDDEMTEDEAELAHLGFKSSFERRYTFID